MDLGTYFFFNRFPITYIARAPTYLVAALSQGLKLPTLDM